MSKKRNYAAEYARRVASAQERGLSKVRRADMPELEKARCPQAL